MEIFINRGTGLFPCLCSTAAEIGSSIPVRLKGIQRHLKMVGWHLEMLGAISTNPIDSIKVCSDGEATDTVWGLLTWVLSGNKAASQQLRKENTPCTNSHSTHKPKKKRKHTQLYRHFSFNCLFFNHSTIHRFISAIQHTVKHTKMKCSQVAYITVNITKEKNIFSQ